MTNNTATGTTTNTSRRRGLTLTLMGAAAVALALAGGCSKDEKKPATKPPSKVTKTPTADMAAMKAGRAVAVDVGAEGFSPDNIPAKPGEHLKLVFTRSSEKGCGIEVVLASTGKKYDLPLNKPVEVHMMAGKSGSIGFACGMNMMKGAVVVQ